MRSFIRQFRIDPRAFEPDTSPSAPPWRLQYDLWIGSNLALAGFHFQPFDPTDPAAKPILRSPCEQLTDHHGRLIFRQYQTASPAQR